MEVSTRCGASIVWGDVFFMNGGFHSEIDIVYPQGREIFRMATGRVVWVGHIWIITPGFGRGPYAVVIDHGQNIYSTYSHNHCASVDIGYCVRAGQKIGAVGNLGFILGRSDRSHYHGNHLHFEVVANHTFTSAWDKPITNDCSAYPDPMGFIRDFQPQR